jgi:elongation factor G
MRVEPLERGKGYEFVDEVVGGAIPQQFIVSCEKGVKTALESGPLAGYPVIDVRVIVYDGKTHPVDSKDIAFQVAARQAFKESCKSAKPVLLEPIMNVEVYIPPEFMGDVTGDLNGKRGRVLGMDQMGDLQVIKAQVPIAEMARYSTDLRSITGGRGSFTMEFSHYEEVPSRFAQEIIAKAAKEKKEEEE